MNIFLSANKFVSQLVEITDALLNFQTYYIFHNFSNFSKNLSSKMKNVSIKLEIVYSIGKRSKHDGCVLSFSFQDIYPSDDERRGRRRKRIQKYIFPLNIEILRASLELFDAGSANPVNFTAQVSMIAESTVYPFFSVPLGERSFRDEGEKVGFDWKAREISADESRVRDLFAFVEEEGEARLSRVEPMKITAKRKVERSFPIMEPGRVATCWPQLHWKLIST